MTDVDSMAFLFEPTKERLEYWDATLERVEREVNIVREPKAMEDKLWYKYVPNTRSCDQVKQIIPVGMFSGLFRRLLREDPDRLGSRDEQGNTLAMRMLKSLHENTKRIAWFTLLLERTSEVDPYSYNDEQEDVLYVASMEYPKMPYLAGLFASIYMKNNIDINSREYTHNKISLIYALLAKGSTHLAVLDELAQLKKPDGNYAIDRSIEIKTGKSPLYIAVEMHHEMNDYGNIGPSFIETVKVLIHREFNPCTACAITGSTPLHLALLVKHDLELIKELLKGHGFAALHCKNKLGLTPLQLIKEMPQGLFKTSLLEIVNA